MLGVSSTSVTCSSTLTVAADTDATTILGRARIGSPASDVAYFAHYDRLSTTDYALFQTEAGFTAVNAPSGQSVNIRINNSSVAQFDDSVAAGNTRFLIYDVDNGTLERVSVGDADSGGAGFKLLRIAN
jgi:hypothetical protein